MASFSALKKPASTQSADTAVCSAFLRACSKLSSPILSKLHVNKTIRSRGKSSLKIFKKNMEDLLKCGDYAGLAVYCEQQELKVISKCM